MGVSLVSWAAPVVARSPGERSRAELLDMESPIQPGKLTIMRAATWSALAMCALVAGACGGGASGAGRASDPGHAGAAASPVTLTLSRADVGRHQRVVAAIDSPVATGVRGRRATGYMLA